MAQRMILAFASSQHGRLGADSIVQHLNDNLLKAIDNMVTGSTDKTTKWHNKDQRQPSRLGLNRHHDQNLDGSTVENAPVAQIQHD
jgi:hypothetical protein